MKLEYIIKKEDEKKKLVDVLKKKLQLSNKMLIKLKKCDDAILVNGKNTFVNYIVKIDDIVIVNLEKTYELEEYKIGKYEYGEFLYNLDIVYEDEYFLCVNKKSQMATHPCSNHRGDTLSDAVYTYFKKKYNNRFNLNLVNRLDRQTSGLVIFARHPYIQELFSKKMQSGNVIKKYIAVVQGIVKKDFDVIEKGISRKENSIITRCINDEGEYAKTEYTVLSKNYNLNYTVLEVRIYTGRTHQIRVHMSYIGHSLLGDYLYNNNLDYDKYISRVALHAYTLEFSHVITHEKIKLIADIPEDIKKLM